MSLAATRAPSPNATPSTPADTTGALVLLVTTDDIVWTQFSAAVPELRLEQHDSIADLIKVWDADRPAVVVIDIRIGTDLGPALRQLSEFSRRLVPIALVDQRSVPVAVKFAASGGLHGQILDSFEPERTRTAIARARAEATTRTAGGAAAAASTESGSRLPKRLLLGAAVAALAVAAAAAWWLRPVAQAPANRPAAAPAATPAVKPAAARQAPAPAPESTPAVTARDSEARAGNADDIDRLLGDARRAMIEKRYVEPESGSALAAFRAVLAIDAANGEARQGVDRIAEVLIGRAEAAVAARDFPTALRAVEIVRNLRPDHPRLAPLDVQIGQKAREFSSTQIEAALQANAFERASTLLKQAERAGNVTPAQVEQLRERLVKRQAAAGITNSIRLAQARLTQGKLIDPAGDSALRYVGDLVSSSDQDNAAEISRLRLELLKRLQTESHTAAVQGRWAETDALLAALRSTGAPQAQISAVEADVAQAKEQVRNAAAAREAAAAAAKVAAAQAAAAAPPVIATSPRLKKALSVQYPESARAAGRQGWVDVDVIVSNDGSPDNVRVVASEPTREFEAAALRAVRQARFDPGRTVDGTAVPAPLRLRVRFALEGQ